MAYVVVFYDVSDDWRRLRVARLLESLGLVRIQRSVFMGRGGFAKARDVVRAAGRLIDAGRDSVAALVVPEDYGRRLLVAGVLLGRPVGGGDVVAVV